MASEIKKLLFEKEETKDDSDIMQLDHVAVSNKVSWLMQSNDILAALNGNMNATLHERKMNYEEEGNIYRLSRTIIIEPPSANEKYKSIKEEKLKPFDIRFLPLHSNQDILQQMYLLILTQNQDHPMANNLLESICLYMSGTAKDRAQYGLILLDEATRTLEENPTWIINILVDYETLMSDVYSNTYKMQLRKLPESSKNRLVIGVINLPTEMPFLTLKRIATQIKGECKAVMAYIPLNVKIGFSDLVNAGFKGIGMFLLEINCFPRRNLRDDVIKFAHKAKIFNLISMLIVDTNDPYFPDPEAKKSFDFFANSKINDWDDI